MLAAFLVASWLLEKSSDPPPVGIPTALPLDYTIHLAVLGAATLACGSYGIWALDRFALAACYSVEKGGGGREAGFSVKASG